MKLPERISLRISCRGATDLSGLIAELIVSSGKKNPYRIYSPKTDYFANATLIRNDFIGQFQDHWESGLTDRAGDIESAEAVVRVDLYDPRWSIQNRDRALAWPLLPYEQTKWASREEQYRYRTSSRNLEFIASPINVDLEKTTE